MSPAGEVRLLLYSILFQALPVQLSSYVSAYYRHVTAWKGGGGEQEEQRSRRRTLWKARKGQEALQATTPYPTILEWGSAHDVQLMLWSVREIDWISLQL